MIRNVQLSDAPAIAGIYNEYLMHTCITFETVPVSDEEMTERIRDISSQYPYFVCEEEGEVLGYCYIHRWKEKEAYRPTAESTVYVKNGHTRQGIGKALMKKLIEASREAGFHVLIACITYPNKPSEKLHQELGFRQVSHFHEVGRKFNQWLDVYDFQLILT